MDRIRIQPGQKVTLHLEREDREFMKGMKFSDPKLEAMILHADPTLTEFALTLEDLGCLGTDVGMQADESRGKRRDALDSIWERIDWLLEHYTDGSDEYEDEDDEDDFDDFDDLDEDEEGEEDEDEGPKGTIRFRPPARKKPAKVPAKPKINPDRVCEIEITLLGTDPRIWRRIAVPASIVLANLHDVIQVVMGWEDDHIHDFSTRDGTRYSRSGEDPDEAAFRLCDIVARGAKFRYTYDFGDSWEHELHVAKVREPLPDEKFPRCLAGERACPPEDCGGIYGYYNILEYLAKSKKEREQDDLSEWLDPEYDPAKFDLDAVNRTLKRFRL